MDLLTKPYIGSNVSSSLILTASRPTKVDCPETGVITIPIFVISDLFGEPTTLPNKLESKTSCDIFFPVPEIDGKSTK